MTATSNKQGHLHQLTALRFFAALAVLFSHLGFLRSNENFLRPVAETLFFEGFSGVAFFFVLSGFILSHTYQTKLQSKAISAKKYFLLRLARIYPLHFLTAAPFALYALVKTGTETLPIILANLGLMHSWVPDATYYFSLNLVSWSLSNELFFYACFVFLTLLSTQTIERLMLLHAFVIGVVIAIALYGGHPNWRNSDGFYITHYLSYISPVSRLLDFIVGIWIYRIASTNTSHTRHEWVSVFLLLATLLLASSLKWPEILRGQIIYLPAMGYVIWSFSSGQGLLSKALHNKRLIFLGEASFALYMLHQPIIMFGYRAYNKLGLPQLPITTAILLTVISIGASVFVYKFIELPIHNRLRKLIDKMA